MLRLIIVLFLMSPALIVLGNDNFSFTKPVSVTASFLRACEENILDAEALRLELPENALGRDLFTRLELVEMMDAPATPGELINLIGDRQVARITPRGEQLDGNAMLVVKINHRAMPNGFSPENITALGYNPSSDEWEKVEGGMMTQTGEFAFPVSLFTDYVAGVIQSPEYPSVGAITPTEIKDFKATSPLAGFTFVEQPTANTDGSARVLYDMIVPKGRQNMTPDVSLIYDSNGGNGPWGLGWAFSLPEISVDGSRGVPRYKNALESESYLYAGEQLLPVAWDGPWETRRPDKVFHPRKESSFARIQRHGTSPQNYWWEVTEKDGSRAFYGGTPEGGQMNNQVVKTHRGKIARWLLTERRDVHDNRIRYDYQRIVDSRPGSDLKGHNRYLRNINYTGHGDERGAYDLVFHLNTGAARRADAFSDCGLGFRQTTASLFNRVEVMMGTTTLRTYEIDYDTGPFGKQLLQRITHRDRSNHVFYSHDLNYYNDVENNGSFEPYQREQTTNGVTDGLRAPMITGDIVRDETTLLGGGKGTTFTVGISVTIGPARSGANKINSIGGHLTFSRSKTWGVNTFVDFDGDGLPDKVYVKNGRLMYRKNLGVDARSKVNFAGREEAGGASQLDNFSRGKTKGTTYGPELTVKVGGFGGYVSKGKTKSKTKVSVYFTHANNDGLLDLAFNGTVYFNRIVNGIPTFLNTSSGTPDPISVTVPFSPDLDPVEEEEEEEVTFEEANPKHDAIRAWRVPFNGRVRVTSAVRLLEDNSPEAQDYTLADGVRASLEYDENELLTTTISEDNFNAHPLNDEFKVKAGRMIFFRLSSNYDGAWDQVHWDPVIQYLDDDGIPMHQLDANGKNVYRYRASEDFLLKSPQEFGVPFTGSVLVTGQLEKPVLSDTVCLKVTRKFQLPDDEEGNETLDSLVLLPGEVINRPFSLSVEVNALDRISVTMEAGTNVDWKAICLTPRLEYQDRVLEGGERVSMLDSTGRSTMAIDATVSPKMFNDVLEKTYHVEQIPDSVEVSGTFSLGSLIFPYQAEDDEPEPLVTFAIKGLNKTYADNTFRPNFLTPNIFNYVLPEGIRNSDDVHLEIYFSSKRLAERMRPLLAVILNGEQRKANIFAATLPSELALGNMYRSWGQFCYRAEGEAGTRPIDPDEVRDAFEEYRNMEVPTSRDPEELDSANDPTQKQVVLMYANPEREARNWRGYDNLTWVAAATMSSSRMGEDNPDSGQLVGDGGTGMRAQRLESRSVTKSRAGNLSYDIPLRRRGGEDDPGACSIPARVSGNRSETNTYERVGKIDLNRDGYDDYIANGRVQYTMPWGDREAFTRRLDVAVFHGRSKSSGWNAGGSLRGAKSTSSGRPPFISQPGGSIGTSGEFALNLAIGGQAGVGIQGPHTIDGEEVLSSWLDVNGDGLPDQVGENGAVRLNLGYEFGQVEYWGFTDIQRGKNRSSGVSLNLSDCATGGGNQQQGGTGPNENGQNTNLPCNPDDLCNPKKQKGFNKWYGSWTLGLSVNKDRTWVTYKHLDVTGDGLPDILTTDEGNELYVAVNLGQQYAEPVLWAKNFRIDHGLAFQEQANAAFTFCINIIFIRICINPKGYVAQGVSKSLSAITDLDNDGTADLLTSDREDRLSYRLSRMGRTNKLKRITAPLGVITTLDYTPVRPSYAMPMTRWVMSSVKTKDGFAGDGQEPAGFEYAYAGGSWDRRERTFLGFAAITTRELAGNRVYRTTERTYANTSVAVSGLPLTEFTTDAAGRPWTSQTFTYTLKNALTGQILPTDYNGNDISVFAARTQVQNETFEGNEEPVLVTTETFTHDRKGNVVTITDFGDGSLEDYLLTTIDYHNLPDRGVYNVAKSVTVTDHEGSLLRQRKTEVDDKGNVKILKEAVTDENFIETMMDYDTYGNLIRIIRPPNHRGQRMYNLFTYDDFVHTYVVEVKDAYGYTSSTTYDYAYGLPLVSTDRNDNRTERTYDERGRLTSLTGPYELQTGGYTIKISYHPNAPVPYAICRHYDSYHNEDILTYTFTDGTGQVIQTKKTAMIWDDDLMENVPGVVVSGRTMMDHRRRITKSYYPTLGSINEITVYSTELPSTAPTRHVFDLLDRETTTILPDSSIVQNKYEWVEENSRPYQSHEITDENGNRKVSLLDQRGRTVRQTAFGDDGPIVTNFHHNLVNELLDVTDDAGNVTRYTRDLLGRELSIDHPGSGLTEMTYDPAGNVLTKITPSLRDREGFIIKYFYDFERLDRIAYPENYRNNVRYTYGEPGSGYNRAGRVVLREDASGAVEYFYGQMGEEIKTIRTIFVNATHILTYVSESTYDSWNRIREMVYPDGEKVTYAYERGGKLQAVTGHRLGETYAYLTKAGYDLFGSNRYLRFGNGTEEYFTYEESRRRLTNLRAKSATAGAFMDYNYDYDAVGNVLGVTNTAVPRDRQLGGSSRMSYTYDALYRLTDAEGVWTRDSREETFALSMTYSSTHDILSKTMARERNGTVISGATYAHDYGYETGTPFRPNRVGIKDLVYDADGNLEAVTSDQTLLRRRMTWDEEKRMNSLTENGYVSSHTYDADHQRVVKREGIVQSLAFNGGGGGFISGTETRFTAYVSPYFVAQSGGLFTKHYFVAGRRISSRIGKGRFNNNTGAEGRGNLAAGNIDFLARFRELEERVNAGNVVIPGHPIPNNEPPSDPYPEDLFPDTTLNLTGPGYATGPPTRTGPHPIPTEPVMYTDTVSAGHGFNDTIGLTRERLQYFYHADHLGSTAYVTTGEDNGGGSIHAFTSYTPFGGVFVSGQLNTPEGNLNYGFTGQEKDEATGLNYYGARYYDAEMSLFTSVDPLAEKYIGWSPYAYVLQNPVRYVDPDGRYVESAIDLLSLGSGIVSATENYDNGAYGALVLDLAGIAVDAVALAIPLVPGGASALIKTGRAATKIGDYKSVKQIGPSGDPGGVVLKQIPDGWIMKPAKGKKGGTAFIDPQNPNGNHVRVMNPDPGNPNPIKQVPNVRQHLQGQYVDKYGNRLGGNAKKHLEESHIRRSEFKFRKE